MNERTYYQRNTKVFLNRSKDYYENNNELLRERAKNKYRELSEEENIKGEYRKKRYHNMSEEKKNNMKKVILRLKDMLHKCKHVSKVCYK